MTAALIALAACAWWWIKALTFVGTAIFIVSYAAVRTLEWREARERRHDAQDAAVFGPFIAYGPLPAVDAEDAEFTAWVDRAFANIQPHRFAETGRQIEALPEVSA